MAIGHQRNDGQLNDVIASQHLLFYCADQALQNGD